MLKKLSLLLLVVISALLVLAACGETPAPNATTTGNILPPTSATNPSPTFPSSLPDYDGPKEVPDYAKDAIKWEATIMGGFVVLDSDYRIVIEDGNEAASAAALYLRMSLKTALGANFTTVTDRIVAGSSTYVEKDKEILVGSVNNRYLADVAFADNEEFLSKYTSKVGAFYIGVSEQKIMILTMDDESIPVAVRFFAEHYVANQTYVEVDGDLSSLYLYDKNEYASSGEISFYSLQELKSKADVVSISLDGKTYASFDAGVKDYTQSIQLSQSAPVITIEPFSPFTNVSIVQATDENGLVSTISVRSDDGTVSNVYKVQFNRLPYDIVDSTLHALKDGARGAITIVQDDGYEGTTKFMYDICSQYGLKFNIGFIANKFGSLQKDENGVYLKDGDGNYVINFASNSSSTSGGGTVGWWKEFIAAHSDTIEVSSHSLTHGSWGTKEENILAELVGSQQILQQTFPGQEVSTFVFPGFQTDTRDEEYAKAQSMLLDYYFAGRGLSSAKWNSLRDPNFQYLETCSLYYVEPTFWGKGGNNNDGWLMKAINNVSTNGGWVVTMNHLIQETSAGLTGGAMNIDQAMFKYAIENYVVPNVESGALWCGFFSEVAEYIHLYNHSTLDARRFADGRIEIVLVTDLDEDRYDAPLTLDITVDSNWDGACLSYTDRNGNLVEEVVEIATATDGHTYVRLNIVPNCTNITLTEAKQALQIRRSIN